MFGIFSSSREAGKVNDPVCKMKVDQEKAKYTIEYKGKKYYFCSEDCRKAFDSSSDKYAIAEGADTSKHCCHQM